MDNELAIVGAAVDGLRVGTTVGAAVDGLRVGSIEGAAVDGLQKNSKKPMKSKS